METTEGVTFAGLKADLFQLEIDTAAARKKLNDAAAAKRKYLTTLLKLKETEQPGT